MGTIIKYEHYGKKVYVDEDLLGKHREHCLCWKCKIFKPESRIENCRIANLNYAICLLTGIVSPVWECPDFEETSGRENRDERNKGSQKQ